MPKTYSQDRYGVQADEVECEADILRSVNSTQSILLLVVRRKEPTEGLSGRPGPGERMIQSMLGRTDRWHSFLKV